jgi:hypothetical protein
MNPDNSHSEPQTWQEFQVLLDRQIAEKRAAANRENARKSTGPRTPEGKAASSQNRLAHGLCSSSLILHGENAEEFDELRRQTHATFAPVTAEETLLTDQLVEATWRLNRARRVEAKSLEPAPRRSPNSNSPASAPGRTVPAATPASPPPSPNRNTRNAFPAIQRYRQRQRTLLPRARSSRSRTPSNAASPSRKPSPFPPSRRSPQ